MLYRKQQSKQHPLNVQSYNTFLRNISSTNNSIIPSDLPYLRIWLESDSGVTKWTSTETVKFWASKTGSVTLENGSILSDRPTVATNQFNGLDGIVFDGSNDMLQFPYSYAFTSGATEFTFYVVLKNVATIYSGPERVIIATHDIRYNSYAQGSVRLHQWNTSPVHPGWTYNAGTSTNKGSQVLYNDLSGAITPITRLATTGKLTDTGNILSVYTNGVTASNTVYQNDYDGAKTIDFRGLWLGNLDNPAGFTIGALLIYEKKHTPTQVAQVDAYLKNKFGGS